MTSLDGVVVPGGPRKVDLSEIIMATETMSNISTQESESWCCTEVKVNKFSYTWTLKNFSFFPEEVGTVITSSTFPAGENDNQKWCLLVYPDGDCAGRKGYLSMYLKLVSCNETYVRAKYTFSLLGAQNEKIKATSCTSSYKFSRGTVTGFSTFVRRDYLDKSSDVLLPDDKLTLFCEVRVLSDPVSTSGQNKAIKFKVSEHDLSKDLGSLFENQKFYDVILNANGTEFCVHRNILAARSPVFAAMFEHEMEENKQNQVKITDVDHEVLREMLLFIYTGKAPNLEKMADDLFVAADKYAVENLKIICEENLCSNLLVETAANVLHLADMHCANQLKAHSIDFIITHATDVMQTDGWKSMLCGSPHLIAEVFGALTNRLH